LRDPAGRHGLAVPLGRDRAEHRPVLGVHEGVLPDLHRLEGVQVAARRQRRACAEPCGRDGDNDRKRDRARDEAGALATPAPVGPLALAAAMREDEVEIVVTAAPHVAPSASSSLTAMRRSLSARSAFSSPAIHLRTVTIALSPWREETYTSSP